MGAKTSPEGSGEGPPETIVADSLESTPQRLTGPALSSASSSEAPSGHNQFQIPPLPSQHTHTPGTFQNKK